MKNFDWSMDLEHNEYAEDIDLIIEGAIEAVNDTEAGHFVNLVTAEAFGHPDDYLTAILKTTFHDTIEMKYIDQCGCGGYVLRVWKKQSAAIS